MNQSNHILCAKIEKCFDFDNRQQRRMFAALIKKAQGRGLRAAFNKYPELRAGYPLTARVFQRVE